MSSADALFSNVAVKIYGLSPLDGVTVNATTTGGATKNLL